MWLAVQPIDMRSGAERLLAQVVQVFGAAQAHHGYLFANARGTRVKLLIHDGFGVWLWASLRAWLTLEIRRVPEGSATAKAIHYSLNHWQALTAYLRDGKVPLDNNHLENLMRPWAMGRKAWLFCGSELAGQRATNVMSLVVSAKLNGHDPWAYLKDVLTRLPRHLNSRIEELLPHRWQPITPA
jgi:Transposase IS66 family/IS66 C-terminal element/IS66 Orf2 like protein